MTQLLRMWGDIGTFLLFFFGVLAVGAVLVTCIGEGLGSLGDLFTGRRRRK